VITLTLYGDPEAFGISSLQQDRVLYALGVGVEELLQDAIPVPLACTVEGKTRLLQCETVDELGPPGRICAAIPGGFNEGFILGDITIDCASAEAIAREMGGCSKPGCTCGKYLNWTKEQATVAKVLVAMKSYLSDQGPWETRAVQRGGITSYEEEARSTHA